MNRVNIHDLQPTAYEAMFGLEKYLGTTDLPGALIELIKTRASQLNGCAFCVQMHSKAALKQNETTDRLLALSAWKESPLFTAQERAVLALTEEMTFISKRGVTDDVYESLAAFFTEAQTAQLIMVITVINAWNRIGVATKMQ